MIYLIISALTIAKIVSGVMDLHTGWRSFWWLNVGIIGLSILMVIFMFPETKWHRAHPDEFLTDNAVKTVDTSSKNSSSADNVEVRALCHTYKGKLIPYVQALPSQRRYSTLTDFNQDVEKTGITRVQTQENAMSRQDTAARDPWLGKGAPSRLQWGVYTPSPNPLKSMLLDVWIPWKLFAFPIVEFSSFVVSWSCSSFLTLNLTQSQNFAAPPYNFSPQSIGFMNFAILAGAMIGLFTAGPLSDWVSARATKKNRGIREPEMRLPAMSKCSLLFMKLPFLT